MTEIHAFDPDGALSPGAAAGIGTALDAYNADSKVAGYVTAAESLTRDALLASLTDTGTRPVGKGEIVLNARDMGALGDGVADDTAALQAALDASAGRDVFIPHGRYRITSTLNVPSGGVVRGENGTVLINDADLPTMIQVNGSMGTRVRLAAAVGTNDRTITTVEPHGLTAGDVVQMRSQRVSTSADAGDWQLGYSTGSSPGPFFGEFGTVQTVTDATTFVLDSGLVFPSYRPDNSQETDPAADAYASVAKVNAARDVVVSTLRLEGPSSMAIRVIYGADCLIENIRYTKPDIGRFIQFHESYRCLARDCWVSNEMDVDENLVHSSVNSYHIVSSQSCGFDSCTAISGTQSFDITYSNSGRIPSLFCFVTNSTASAALNNPLTVHPGTYAPVVMGNNFSECRMSGPSIRGNRAVVLNNTIRGSGGNVGISFIEGGGRDSIVSGNLVANFDTALQVTDGANKNYPGWIGITFATNTLADCRRAYTRVLGWQRPLQTGPEGIVLSGNQVVSRVAGAIGFETSQDSRPIWGLTIQGNTFRLPKDVGSAAVLVRNNARAVAVLGNTIFQARNTMLLDESGMAYAWPTPSVVEYTGNNALDVSNAGMTPNTPNIRMSSRDPEPHTVASPQLDLYTETIAIKAGANADVNAENNFPVSNTACIVEVKRWDSNFTVQQVTATTGDMYQRRRSGTSWGAWSKRH